MDSLNKYFVLYEDASPPPIITEGSQKVIDFYNQFVEPYTFSNSSQSTIQDNEQIDTHIINNIKSEQDSNNPIQIDTDKPDFKLDINPAQKAVDIARQFIGTKYSWGGSTPSTGFDCSGLVQYAYKQAGIDIPRTAKQIEKFGQEVSLQDIKVGDIVCTPGTGSTGKHIKIVSKIDNGQVYTIEAKGKKYGIIEEPLSDVSDITSIRRISNNLQSSYNSNNSIVNYFVNKGLTLSQAKGIYGNLMQESQGKINAQSNDGNNSYGIAQWTGVRKQRLFNMYGNNPSLQDQLDFLWWELNNTHKDALKSLRQSSTVYDSTKVFMDKFEKPHRNYANFNRRLKYANSV